MNKKLLIIVISSVLALALVITGVILILKSSFFKKDFNGSSSKNTVITVESVSGKKGKTVTVPVSIKGNPGFMTMLLSMDYDTEVLKYKGYQKSDFLTDYEFSDIDGTLRFLTLEDTDINKNGVFVNIVFEILDDKVSETKITFNTDENQIANSAQKFVTAEFENGVVKIK